jgi:hypothetical protein
MKEDSMQRSDVQHISPNTIRIEIARRIVERKRQELDEHFIAAACYGSVAHNAALPHSDIEIVIVTDDTVTANETQFFEQGIMVECDVLPASRMLTAARRVTLDWGIEADQYLHHLVICDPNQFFPRLWAVASDLPQENFDNALKVSWWDAYEIRGKVYNALLAEDHPRMSYTGCEFAYSAAMHIALHERKPYESGRTLWQDVITRGYGMKELVDVLSTGALDKIIEAVDNVWDQIKAWGTPEEYHNGQ